MKIGILSDIHEDLKNLKKAFEILDNQDCEEFVCLGDISGYSVDVFNYYERRNANDCLSLIKSRCSIVIPGNHDLYNVRRIPEFISSFIYPDNWYDLSFDERESLAENSIWLYEQFDLSPMLSRKNKSYLNSLPEFVIHEFEGIKILFSHYAFPDFSGSSKHFIESHNELSGHFEVMETEKCQISFSGHSHPEAGTFATPKSFDILDFGKHKIPDEKSWIIVPSIAESNRKRGVSVFDTEEMTLNFIQIS